jgi:hypothetical protein
LVAAGERIMPQPPQLQRLPNIWATAAHRQLTASPKPFNVKMLE